MPLYYAKHHQMNAFKFNGTWTQLMNELPPLVITDIINREIPINVIYDKNHYIDAIEMYDDVITSPSYWPMVYHNRHINHKHHHNSAYHNGQLYYHISNEMCYTYRKLKRGDYVHVNSTQNPVELEIYTPANFESHWTLKSK